MHSSMFILHGQRLVARLNLDDIGISTTGIDALFTHPDEYERRVVGFLDQALLQDN